MASASQFYIGANDEHGLYPPTAGKRTPVMPYINRSFYENEYNRQAKNNFIEACLRCGFNVFDVKPEFQDVSVSTRVSRVNYAKLTMLVTFGYNAFGSGNTFNSAKGMFTYYGALSSYRTNSRILAEDIFEELSKEQYIYPRSVISLTDVGVLESVNCPSMISEAGFMTNFTEAKLMLDPDFVLNAGEASCRGVCDNLSVEYIERNNLSAYPTLRRGSRGNKVALAQYLLNYYNYSIDTDGVFGLQTQNAVIKFQQENGLTGDGIIGPLTWTALLDLSPTSKTIKYGSVSSNVMYAQRKLLSKLYYASTLDGDFGTKTQTAVTQFQSENNLVADGIIGANTWAKLAVLDEGRPLT